MPITEFDITTLPDNALQTLKINKSKRFGQIEAVLRTFLIQDGKFKVVYLPSFDITAYGKTEKKANEMLEDYFDSLIMMNLVDIKLHLKKLGWSATVFRKKFENGDKFDNRGILRKLELPPNTKIKKLALKVA